MAAPEPVVDHDRDDFRSVVDHVSSDNVRGHGRERVTEFEQENPILSESVDRVQGMARNRLRDAARHLMKRSGLRMRCALVVQLVWIGCAGDGTPALVVFDESLGEPFSIHDPGFMGDSLASEALQAAGLQVTANRQPLDDFLPKVPDPTRTLLVISLPTRHFSPRALRATSEFLESGGRLLFLAEHDNIYDNASIIEDFVQRSGIKIGPGRLAGPQGTVLLPWPVSVGRSDPLTLDSVHFYLAARLEPTGEPTVILLEDHVGEPLTIGAIVGNGRLAVAGDAEFLWNGTPTHGIRAAANEEYLLKIVRWLLEDLPSRSNTADVVTDRPVPGGVVAVEDRYRRRFGSTPDGYSALLDSLAARGLRITVTNDSAALVEASAVVVPEPSLALLPGVRDARRVVLLLGEVSAPPVRPGATPRVDHPAARWLQTEGIDWMPGTVNGPFGDATVHPSNTCTWERAALLHVSDRAEAVEVHEWSDSPAYQQILPWVTAERVVLVDSRPPTHKEGWPMVVTTPTLFLVASGSVLSNAQSGGECFTSLVSRMSAWLQPGSNGESGR